MTKTVLIIGATSAIARAGAAAFAAQGYHLFLAGRNADELRRIAVDLAIRYGKAGFCRYRDDLRHARAISGCRAAIGRRAYCGIIA